MTTENSTDQTAAPDAPAAKVPSPRRSRLRNAFAWTGSAAADVGRASAPTIRRVAARIGDWLTTVGWGKFFFIALLLIIVGAIADNVFYNTKPVVVVQRGEGKDRVQVNLQVAPDGVRIQAPIDQPPPPRSRGEPSVKIDDKGLRIIAGDKNKRVAVVIDEKGIRVDKNPSDTGKSDAGKSDTEISDEVPGVTVEEDGRTVTISPEFTQDPQQLALALDKARDQIEEIVEKQIERQIARETRRYRAHTGDWLMSFVMLLIMAGIIVKVVLGGKKRAERRAEAATETAAEESLKRQLAEAQLKTMQAQVEPHFLFNTLASVDYLIETAPSTASKMQKSLIQYLRAALPQMREGSTTLGKEVQLCRSYLEILKFRMEDRLQYSLIIPQGLSSAQFPPMMLQSLVENSIKHGLEPKPEGGSLSISADISNGRLRVTVADSGLGFAAAGVSGSGVGLANVRERLAALYGGAAKLSIEANSPSGTIVTIEVPYTFETDTRSDGKGNA
ncbi:MAG TPA: histidine kinase [Burkholderiaceae bacterium]|nr:histidine kinase [Burkholderiaceae bacterium]